MSKKPHKTFTNNKLVKQCIAALELGHADATDGANARRWPDIARCLEMDLSARASTRADVDAAVACYLAGRRSARFDGAKVR